MTRMPRFSLAFTLWLTAIVAVVAALPRGYVQIKQGAAVGDQFVVNRYDFPILLEIIYRGVWLALTVWVDHIAVRWVDRRRQRRLKDSHH
jgi:hypothetical protein